MQVLRDNYEVTVVSEVKLDRKYVEWLRGIRFPDTVMPVLCLGKMSSNDGSLGLTASDFISVGGMEYVYIDDLFEAITATFVRGTGVKTTTYYKVYVTHRIDTIVSIIRPLLVKCSLVPYKTIRVKYEIPQSAMSKIAPPIFNIGEARFWSLKDIRDYVVEYKDGMCVNGESLGLKSSSKITNPHLTHNPPTIVPATMIEITQSMELIDYLMTHNMEYAGHIHRKLTKPA